MKIIERLKEKLPYKRALSVSAVALILSGCSTTIEQAREDLSAVERIDLEFGGDAVKNEIFGKTLRGNSCLEGTPYDPIVFGDRNPALAEISSNDDGGIIVTLTPASEHYENAQPIGLTGFDNFDGPLVPADEASEQKMDAFGCFDS